jgi:hypothetical protein
MVLSLRIAAHVASQDIDITAIPRPKQIEGNVFYLTLGYFISYLPYGLLAKALSSGIAPGVESPSAMTECISGAVMATARSGHVVTITSAGVKPHVPGAPMTDAAYAALAEAGVIPPVHRSRPQAVRARPAEQFP